LDGVSLDLKAGEIHALMGENGAGKSTLIKIITGLYRPDAGLVLLDGRPVEFAAPRDALAAGISAVHQERNLIPRFSVGENILLMDEPTASITDHETAALFTLLKRLRDDGVAIIFVSHKLEEIFAIADRVTVLRDGRNAATGEAMADMTRPKLVSLMIGREE